MNEEVVINLPVDQAKLLVVSIRAAAALSRNHRHNKQADEFSELADIIQRQVDDHEEAEAFDDPGENRTFLDD
jgi:hypothetical protein